VAKLISLKRPQFTNTELGEFFKISPEAIRRILKNSWRPTAEEQTTRIERWQRRRQRIAAEAIKRHAFREQATSLQRYKHNLDSSAMHTKMNHAVPFAKSNFSRSAEGVHSQNGVPSDFHSRASRGARTTLRRISMTSLFGHLATSGLHPWASEQEMNRIKDSKSDNLASGLKIHVRLVLPDAML